MEMNPDTRHHAACRTQAGGAIPITLLAPARDKQTAFEAIRHGADAVYIGAERFGARQAAGNSVADIAEVCGYAHIYGVRVFVTVNTILYDDELPEVERLVWQLYRVGVDALIVQDMAFMRLNLPPIALHASTQMDNRSSEKVAWLWQKGFTQAVLARELSLEEIADIHARVPQMPLEAFVHGSICVCYNGQCYASQYCFGRSANRGECAQFCRLPFDLEDETGRIVATQSHLLSLHDMNRGSHVEAMMDAGVMCFKVEGRLKDTSYVKNVTAWYRQRIDEIVRRRPSDYCRSSVGHETFSFEPQLERSFNRGFTDYFLKGRSRDLIQSETPKSIGQMVGTVKEIRRDSFNVAGVCSFTNGDGLCFIDDNHKLQGFRVNRVEGNRLYPHEMPRGLRPRMRLYRNYDQAFERLLSHASAERRIDVSWRMTAVDAGYELVLTSSDGISVRHAFDYAHEPARSSQKEAIERQLARLGDTPYQSVGVEVMMTEPLFVPASVLSGWRRQLVQMLTDARLAAYVTEGEGLKRRDELIDDSRQAAVDLRTAMGDKMTNEGGLTYQANVSNREAKLFYESEGAEAVERAFELVEPDRAALMTTRYCVRYQLGMCPRQRAEKAADDGRRSSDREVGHTPKALYLRPLITSRGVEKRRFRLNFDCKRCLMHVLSCLVLLFMLSGCYYPNHRSDVWDVPVELQDSIDFVTKHHYSEGYNFDVWSDSLVLQTEIPHLAQALVDSPDVVVVYEHEPLVVADVYIDTTDVADSVWIKVARDQLTQGWVHESELLPNVVPDDPISQSIMLFSSGHLQWTLVFIALAVVVGLVIRGRRRTYRMPHVNDICSPYPTLLCLLMSGAAVLYASIQMYAPQTWAEYYYHPTLNPFELQPVLGAFVASVWLMIVLSVAVVDDVLRQLHFADAVSYLLSVLALMAVEYVLFSISTLHFVGYFLYLIYIIWALWRYFTSFHPRYRCGRCGLLMHDLGCCPRCGADNR